jgi:hypothetical protein
MRRGPREQVLAPQPTNKATIEPSGHVRERTWVIVTEVFVPSSEALV